MFENIKKIFLLSLLTFFIFMTTNYYFSTKNIRETNKLRSTNLSNDLSINLPVLENDTNNIIVSSDDVEKFKKKRKRYKFFDLLGK